jgi:hypothetical protein
VFCSRRRDANRCPWVRCVARMTRNSRSGELCRPATWPRTQLWLLRASESDCCWSLPLYCGVNVLADSFTHSHSVQTNSIGWPVFWFSRYGLYTVKKK